MKHNKESHVCRFFVEAKYDFSEEICWFRHDLEEKDKIQLKEFECRFCGKIFKTKPNFMMH